MSCNRSSEVNIHLNISEEQQAFDSMKQTIYNVIMPAICGLGILGNLLNLIIFGFRLSRRCLDNLERSATVGLIALAISDLLFCMVGLPAGFLRHQTVGDGNSRLALLAFYYSLYKTPLMNLFLLTSTWLICLISLERFVVVCKPIRARWVIRVRKTLAIHSVICLVALLMCIPEFMRYKVLELECFSGCICHSMLPAGPLKNKYFKLAYKIVWTILGTFLPLVILIVCNIRLIIELYRSKALGIADPARYCTPRITLVVVGIVVSFLLLVCPSMIMQQVSYMTITRSSPRAFLMFRTAVVIGNLLQTCKFASNFLLYCAVNKQFRENLGNIMRKSSSKNSSETTNRYNMVELA